MRILIFIALRVAEVAGVAGVALVLFLGYQLGCLVHPDKPLVVQVLAGVVTAFWIIVICVVVAKVVCAYWRWAGRLRDRIS